MNFRGIFSKFCFFGLPVVLIAISLFFGKNSVYSNFGTYAEYLLVAIMFAKPIGVLLKSDLILNNLNYRRELGVAIFWLALFHAVSLIITKNMFDLAFYFNLSKPAFYGVFALLGLLILTATSNNYSMRKLKANWKKVQHTAYLVLLLTLVHSSMASNGNLNKFFIVGGLFIILKILEFRKQKK